MNFALQNTVTKEVSQRKWHTRQGVLNALKGIPAGSNLEIVEVPDEEIEQDAPSSDLKVWRVTVGSKNVVVLSPTIKGAYRELREYLVQAKPNLDKAAIQNALVASYEGNQYEEIELGTPGVAYIL